MNENEKYLKEARAYVKEFEDSADADLLEEAYLTLENVLLLEEEDPIVRNQLRKEILHLWLHLIALLDRFLDPHFDPDDVPMRTVKPPPTSEGIKYRPGTSPSKIKDPTVRDAYEEAIAANNAKIAHYNLQIDLRRLEESIIPLAEAFVHNFYTPAPVDQAELKSAIDATIKDSQRKGDWLKRLTR